MAETTNTRTGGEVIATARANGGWLSMADVEQIANDPSTRLTLLLVRCGGGRFLAPAQDVGHFIAIIDEHSKRPDSAETDYIRDVSLPAQAITNEEIYRTQLIDVVETLEFLVASTNCVAEAAANRGKSEAEVWNWFNGARNAMLAAKRREK